MTPAATPPLLAALPAERHATIFQKLGYVVLLTYLISGQLNEWAIRWFGGKAYVSTVALAVLPVILLICATAAARSLKHLLGLFWALFLVWMLVCTPTSVWKGGSVTFLINYIPRQYLMFFYCAAFAVSVAQIRKMFYFATVQGTILLITCWQFGQSSSDNRLFVPDSMFYTNSNELALSLLIAATQFLFLLYGGNLLVLVAGLGGVLGCIYYMLQTGSRGCTLALLVLLAAILWTSNNKLKVLVIALPVISIPLLIRPSIVFHRLTLIGLSDTVTGRTNDFSAIASQQQRQQLFERSIYHTLHNPVLGVGPNQFAVAENGQKAARGEWGAWLGTHNSYTQVSSECGLPGLFLYVGTLVIALRLAFRMYKSSRDQPRLKDIARVSFCLFCGLVIYGVASTFFHMAYTGGLPLLAGMTLALWSASRARLEHEANLNPLQPLAT